MTQQEILRHITEFFVKSYDSNGISLTQLANELGITAPKLKRQLSALVRKGKITLAFYSHSGNPHIKRIADLPVDEQLRKFETESDEDPCLYPTADVIKSTIDISQFGHQPFTKRIKLGEPQLTPVFFEPDVLEKYYRDPRYRFDFDDNGGSIVISSEHYESKEVNEKDKILLESFGIGYHKEKRHRVVVAYLRYLSDVSAEHQQLWNSYKVDDPCVINSDYAGTTLHGTWAKNVSVYAVILAEQAEINKIVSMIGLPPLFRQTFVKKRPAGFHAMLRPTRRSFDEFTHVFDKILSENINHDFFGSNFQWENEKLRDDGKTEVTRIGTLQALEIWLSQKYRTQDGKDIGKEILKSFRDIRKLRQSPAHGLHADDYDHKYVKQQSDLLEPVWHTLTSLRLIFSSHPVAKDYVPPKWLEGNNVVIY